MLWDASAINGYDIEASDGRLGTVSDLLFDDVGWAIRWLVVDTGNWPPGRKVLLPPSALKQSDRTLRHFSVKLTMQQVKDSTDVDTDQPDLRSIATVTGYHIHATDGEIGHVDDFLVDDASWTIRYVAVDTKNWRPGKKVLISLRSAREIDSPKRLIHLIVNRQKVKDGPPYDASIIPYVLRHQVGCNLRSAIGAHPDPGSLLSRCL
jgi:hypothetical protein